MDPKANEQTAVSKAFKIPSAIKAMISWLIKADRECRVTQTMLDERRTRF